MRILAIAIWLHLTIALLIFNYRSKHPITNCSKMYAQFACVQPTKYHLTQMNMTAQTIAAISASPLSIKRLNAVERN